jgi:hypothetical protein
MLPIQRLQSNSFERLQSNSSFVPFVPFCDPI